MSLDNSAVPQDVAEHSVGDSIVPQARDNVDLDLDQPQPSKSRLGKQPATQAMPSTSIDMDASSQAPPAGQSYLDLEGFAASSAEHPPTNLIHNEQDPNDQAGSCATVTPLESKLSRDSMTIEGQAHDSASPPNSSNPSPRQKSTPTLSINTSVASGPPPTSSYIPPSRQPPKVAPPPAHHQGSKEGWAAAGLITSSTGIMLSSTKAAQRRRNMANTSALTEYEADMTSRDRTKQKEAIKKFVDEVIEDDWRWQWPQPSTGTGTEFVDQLARTGRTAVKWQERDEWHSNTNNSDSEPAMPTVDSPDSVSPTESFKFESPDDVGDALKRRQAERKLRRERKLKEELKYNDGLRCFEERRNAWTGARTVPRPMTRTASNTLSTIANLERSEVENGTAEINGGDDEGGEMIEIPIAPPFLPPNNSMRTIITPTAYGTIYDKVVLQGVTPQCPVPLPHLLRSCVQGWKRDGLWAQAGLGAGPEVPPIKKKTRKLSVASIFGLSKHDKHDKEAKDRDTKDRDAESQTGIRKSLQKFLNLGHKDHREANGNEHAIVETEDLTARPTAA